MTRQNVFEMDEELAALMSGARTATQRDADLNDASTMEAVEAVVMTDPNDVTGSSNVPIVARAPTQLQAPDSLPDALNDNDSGADSDRDGGERGDDFFIMRVKLCDIRIDPGQPRQCLPADLRAKVAAGQLTAPDALRELCRRAKSGDVEASEYLSSIRELAASIATDGLIYPIKVDKVEALPDEQWIIRDGERRYWACVYVCLDESPVVFEALEFGVFLSNPLTSESVADVQGDMNERRREQWVANLQRRNMPVMALAEELARIEQHLGRIFETDRAGTLQRYGLADPGAALPQRERGLLLEMTRHELQTRTGKLLSLRMVRRCLMIAHRLTAEARSLAHAASLDYRALERIASLPLDSQAQAIKDMQVGTRAIARAETLSDDATAGHTPQAAVKLAVNAVDADGKRAGPNAWVERRVNQFVMWGEQVMDIERISRALIKADADSQQAYFDAARTTRDRLMKLIVELETRLPPSIKAS